MPKLKVFVASNAHIDSEWLWPLEETVEVCKNTFSNVLTLMDKYPELTYIQSSSLYYELMEKKYPEIFKKIVSKIKSDNWKIVGGSFLEFDPNMPSGESIVRHFLIGQKYFKRKFGINAKTFWLPDSFGFPASLPQLLKKAGLEYFVTHKLKWNDTTEFPYYIFKWFSKDTSHVLSLHIPGNYSDYLFSIEKVLLNYYFQLRKQKIPVLMQIFGIGDHGGGPDEKEVVNVIKWKRKFAKINFQFSSFEEFFNEIKRKYLEKLPKVVNDELYLEFHRGVFTTGAKIKWLNRYNEHEILQTEKIFLLLKLKYGVEYPKRILDSLWRAILLTHGHDMMSSTVIPEVYLRGIKRGHSVKHRLDALVEKGIKELAYLENARYLVFNPNNWETSVYIRTTRKFDGKFQKLSDGSKLIYVNNIPPLGYKAINKLEDEPTDETHIRENKACIIIENRHLNVKVSKRNGWILSIYDKMNKKEVLRGAARLRVYFDYPIPGRGILVPSVIFDAWEVYNREIPNKYFFKDLKAKKVSVKERGKWYSSITAYFEYKQFRREKSIFELEIGLYANKPYVEIKFHCKWKTWHRLLKFVVPLNTSSREATFEVPYGTVKRLDAGRTKKPSVKAKYEVCGQKWVDVSDNQYGVAIIDDSKYGYSWINGCVELSLLRSPTFPLRDVLLIDPESYKAFQRSFADYKIATFRNKLVKVFIHLMFILNLFFGYLRNRSYYRPMDQGTHEARIWIYPHEGNFVKGNVPQIAIDLNTNYRIVQGSKGIEKTFSFIKVQPQNLIHLTVLKPSEDNPNGIIVRLFNLTDKCLDAKIKFNFEIRTVKETNLIEDEIRKINLNNKIVKLRFNPNEIKTLFLEYGT